MTRLSRRTATTTRFNPKAPRNRRRQGIANIQSAADCSISLKSAREFDHVTADALQLLKVKESKVRVTC